MAIAMDKDKDKGIDKGIIIKEKERGLKTLATFGSPSHTHKNKKFATKQSVD